MNDGVSLFGSVVGFFIAKNLVVVGGWGKGKRWYVDGDCLGVKSIEIFCYGVSKTYLSFQCLTEGGCCKHGGTREGESWFIFV